MTGNFKSSKGAGSLERLLLGSLENLLFLFKGSRGFSLLHHRSWTLRIEEQSIIISATPSTVSLSGLWPIVSAFHAYILPHHICGLQSNTCILQTSR